MADFTARSANANALGELIDSALSVYTTINYSQRIWDTTVGGWCYYTQTAVNATPATTDTTPNNYGTFLAGSHTILRVY